LGIREDTGDPVEEDKEWLKDHEKAEGKPDDIVDENLREVHCDACEDENQPNSPDDESHETQNNITPNRTWVVEPERLRKPKPRKRRRVKKDKWNDGVDPSYLEVRVKMKGTQKGVINTVKQGKPKSSTYASLSPGKKW
jgi:hypothetical protein